MCVWGCRVESAREVQGVGQEEWCKDQKTGEVQGEERDVCAGRLYGNVCCEAIFTVKSAIKRVEDV